jgi:hypothetical protein
MASYCGGLVDSAAEFIRDAPQALGISFMEGVIKRAPIPTYAY